MKYMLLIYNCDRPDPTDPRFPDCPWRMTAPAASVAQRAYRTGMLATLVGVLNTPNWAHEISTNLELT